MPAELTEAKVGGGPDKDRLGFRYWKDPGAANTYLADGDSGRFVALLSTLVLSAFPFSFAPELLVATVSCPRPHQWRSP